MLSQKRTDRERRMGRGPFIRMVSMFSPDFRMPVELTCRPGPVVANMLETNLLPVNTNSALRPPSLSPGSQVGKGVRLEQTESRVKKNQREKLRRDDERSQLERIGYLFKVAEPRKCWTRTELLSFGEIFFFIRL